MIYITLKAVSNGEMEFQRSRVINILGNMLFQFSYSIMSHSLNFVVCLEHPYFLMKDLKSINHAHNQKDVMKHNISFNINNMKRNLFFLFWLSVGSPSIDIVSVYLFELSTFFSNKFWSKEIKISSFVFYLLWR